MKLMIIVVLTAIGMSANANENRRIQQKSIGPMWGNWGQGARVFFINHQLRGPYFIWMTINGTQLVFKGKVVRLAGPDGVVQSSLYEIDGNADKDLPVTRRGIKCFLRKLVFSMLGLLSKEKRKLNYGGIGSIRGELRCTGQRSKSVSMSLSGTWTQF